jgi:hypothetical protein
MAAQPAAGDTQYMTQFRRGAVWFVVSLLVFMLIATLLLDQAA